MMEKYYFIVKNTSLKEYVVLLLKKIFFKLLKVSSPITM